MCVSETCTERVAANARLIVECRIVQMHRRGKGKWNVFNVAILWDCGRKMHGMSIERETEDYTTSLLRFACKADVTALVISGMEDKA